MSSYDGGGGIDFTAWLSNYLKQTKCELDIDVIGEYVSGILDKSNEVENGELHSAISEVLSAYMPASLARSASKTIVERYFSFYNRCASPGAAEHSETGTAGDTLEERMRALLVAERERFVLQQQAVGCVYQCGINNRYKRDSCTMAVLRDAGVAGYQSDSDEERSVEIAVANAEFQAKQRLNAAITDTVAVNASENPLKDSADVLLSEEVDMGELEELSGYGKKLDAKPGTVMDALAEFKSTTLVAPACRQMPLESPSQGLANFTFPAFTSGASVERMSFTTGDNADDPSGRGRKKSKRKSHIISKHIARVGAQAEADTKRQQALVNVQLHGVGARQEEMGAFLFGDSDDSHDGLVELPAAGQNPQRMLAAGLPSRNTAVTEGTGCCTKANACQNPQPAEVTEREKAFNKRAQRVERKQ